MEKREREFWDFLDTLNIMADKMKGEKVGPDVITLMSDEDLSTYVEKHGDRVRIRKFIKDQTSEVKSSNRKSKLLDILRGKIENRRRSKRLSSLDAQDLSDEDMRAPTKHFGNKHAAKKTRKIKLGWIHRSKDKSVHIREKKGGGTREIDVDKNATSADIIKIAKQLFFTVDSPQFKEVKDLKNFDYCLCDYSEREITQTKTVEQMYQDTKLPRLRFYLLTKESTDSPSEVEEDLPEMLPDSRTATATSQQQQEESSANLFPVDDADLFTMSPLSPLQDEDAQYMLGMGDDIVEAAMAITGINEDVAKDPTQVEEKLVTVHRGQVLKELISNFKDVDFRQPLKIQVIDPAGNVEVAEDGGGVTRDVLCEFWSSFYDECTEGSQIKVPCIRHDFGEEEWCAIAKIMVFGKKDVGYFPVLLSQVFLEQCFFGNIEANLRENFLLYLAETDRVLLRAALNDITSVDMEELLDLMSRCDAKVMPTPDNIIRVVNELAHKELVQKPMFVVDCWKHVVKDMAMTRENIVNLYRDYYPTTKKVIEKLHCPEIMNADEAQTANHLKRFVRELDEENLKRFLRFTTGSDLLVCSHIDVAFVVQSSFARRPVAHTCSCLLELARNYENFPQFRKEFKSVLESSVWVMDII